MLSHLSQKDKQTVKELKSLINDLVEEREKYLKIIQSIIIDEANELNKRITRLSNRSTYHAK